MPASEDPSYLSGTTTRETIRKLCEHLPLPCPDTPENRAARDDFAIGAFASLNPHSVAEANIAANIVLFGANADIAVRLASRPGQDPQIRRTHRAQAADMMRRAQDLLRDLHQRQLARADAEAAARPTAHARDPLMLQPNDTAAASEQRAARTRGLDLHAIELSATRH